MPLTKIEKDAGIAWIRATSANAWWSDIPAADAEAAFLAVHDWLVANQAAFNAALPEPFRSSVMQHKKWMLLCDIVQRLAGSETP